MVLMVLVLETGEVMAVVGMGVGMEVLGHQVVRMKELQSRRRSMPYGEEPDFWLIWKSDTCWN